MTANALAETYPDLKRLLSSIQRCQGFGLFFAKCNLPSLQASLILWLKNQANAPPIMEVAIQSLDAPIDSQISQHVDSGVAANTVVFVTGLERLFQQNPEQILHGINWRRNAYARLAHPIVFWLPDYILDAIAQNAPDFYDWYSGFYEFDCAPDERQLLIDMAWQDLGDVNLDASLSVEEKRRWLNTLLSLLAEIKEANGEERRKRTAILLRLAGIYKDIGQYDAALNYYQQALTESKKIGDQELEGTTLNNIAGIYHARGDYNTALSLLQRSLVIQEDAGDLTGVGATLNNISDIHRVRGNYVTALSMLQRSLAIQEKIGDLAGVGATLNNISQIYRAQGDGNTALSFLQRALLLQEKIGDQIGSGTTLNNIALIYMARGDYDAAQRLLQQSLTVCEKVGDQAGLCNGLFNIGFIYLQMVQRKKAQQAWLKSYRIAKTLNLAEGLARLEQLAKQLGSTDGLQYFERLAQQDSDQPKLAVTPPASKDCRRLSATEASVQ